MNIINTYKTRQMCVINLLIKCHQLYVLTLKSALYTLWCLSLCASSRPHLSILKTRVGGIGPRLAKDPALGFMCDITTGNSIVAPSQLNALVERSTGNSPLSYSGDK